MAVVEVRLAASADMQLTIFEEPTLTEERLSTDGFASAVNGIHGSTDRQPGGAA